MPSDLREGDRVKVITDTVNPDMVHHGRTGEIIDVSKDDAGSVTGNPEDDYMYTVQFENGEVPDIHFRRRDLVYLEEHEEELRTEL
jgi:hypothetical protein